MSDYTPTTEQVKNWYVVGKNELESAPYSYSEQEFDRWLESVKREAFEDGWHSGFDTAAITGAIL